MAVKFTNNARTTLAADITNSATTATVTSGAVFPELNAGEYFYCTFDNGTNNEIVKVTARSGNTLTIVRGVDNSTARAFVADDAAELRATAGLLTDIQENLAAKSANQTIYNATTASNATAYDIGIDPGQESNAMVFLNGVMQHHDTFSFSSSTLTFDTAPVNGTALEVIVDNLINLQSSNLTTDTFTATSGQTAFVLSDAPAAENNLIVFIDGVFQDQSNYSISDHTLTLATGAVVGRTVTVYIINPVNIGTPSDGTVTTSKLSGNITMPGTLTVGAFDVAFDSPTFFVDNSNSRVGLGTATPSVPVDIVGEVKISSHLTLGTTSKVQFGDSGTYIHQSADGVLDLVSDTEIEINATTIDVNGALDVSGAITGTLATAAQPNITSLGTLTGLTTTGDINFGDNDKAIFGAGSDLQIYHDGSNSYIKDTGTGRLTLQSATDFLIANTANTQNYIYAQESGYVRLYYAGATKLATTSTGIDVTGTATMDGLSVDGAVGIGIVPSEGKLHVKSDGVGEVELLTLENSTGTNGKTTLTFKTTSTDATKSAQIFAERVNASGHTDLAFRTYNGSTTEAMRIDSSGNVGIGTTSPSRELVVENDAATSDNSSVSIISGNAGYAQLLFGDSDTDTAGYIAYQHSNNSLQIASGGAERVRIDSSGRLGIGTTSPSSQLHIESGNAHNKLSITSTASGGTGYDAVIDLLSSAASSEVAINMGINGDADREQIKTYQSAMTFRTNNTERLRVDSSGNVGIGVTNAGSYDARAEKLVVGETGDAGITISSGATSDGRLVFAVTNQTDLSNGSITYDQSADSMSFETSGSEHMRIDSSGNLLVGKTSQVLSTEGISISPTGYIQITETNSPPLYLNRKGTDGTIINFYKDSSVIGSIGTQSDDITIGNDNVGLRFGYAGLSNIIPVDIDNNDLEDNVISLGHANARFDDIFATNGTIQTSDRNEKQDIAELTDAETRVAVAAKGLLRKFRWQSAVAEKGDEARTHFGIIAQDLQDAFTAEGLDAGDYAMFISNTWTDDDGVEQTRLGVRYSELLAFIIAAI